MIDLHCHILPYLDDGARDLEDSLAIARACVAGDVVAVAATPHVRGDHPTMPEQMERQLEQLRQEIARHRIPLELHGGGEIAVDFLERLSLDELRRFGLAGNPHYLLLELPFIGWPLALEHWVARLREFEITAVLAHPERNSDVQDDPARLERFVEHGALLQVTAASIDGRLGKRARAAAAQLLEHGLVHLVASDAHHPAIREAGLGNAVGVLQDEELANWLTVAVPSAIVNNDPLPPRPHARRPSRFWRHRSAGGT